MRRASFIVFVLVLWLATCRAPEPKVPAVLPTATVMPPAPTETQVPAPKLPAAPFEAQTYINEEAGFALEVPASWTIRETVVGERGTQILFLSKPEVADLPTMPAGETRLSATVYQWDPKNDLPAYVQKHKAAWEASGFTLLEEQPLVLEQGLAAEQFTLQTAETESVFLITALQDRYLVISGEGDLDLVKQILERLRPIS